MNKYEVTFPKWMHDDLVRILTEYRHMKERDDFDPRAVEKMQQAQFILDHLKEEAA